MGDGNDSLAWFEGTWSSGGGPVGYLVNHGGFEWSMVGLGDGDDVIVWSG